MTVALIVIVGFWSIVAAASIAHNIRRIADAIEAQNRHYDIGLPRPIRSFDEKDAA